MVVIIPRRSHSRQCGAESAATQPGAGDGLRRRWSGQRTALISIHANRQRDHRGLICNGQRSSIYQGKNLNRRQQANALNQRDFAALVDFQVWVDGLLPGLKRLRKKA
jgi:hypothetical protein